METQPSYTIAQLQALYSELSLGDGETPTNSESEVIDRTTSETAAASKSSSEGNINESDSENSDEEGNGSEINSQASDEERCELARLRTQRAVLRLRQQVRELQAAESTASATVPAATAVSAASASCCCFRCRCTFHFRRCLPLCPLPRL